MNCETSQSGGGAAAGCVYCPRQPAGEGVDDGCQGRSVSRIHRHGRREGPARYGRQRGLAVERQALRGQVEVASVRVAPQVVVGEGWERKGGAVAR